MTVETISVVIPLYNGSKYLEEALNSVFKQDRPADEIIVVDDGSTDGGKGRAVAERFPVKVYSKDNGGQGSARNFGVNVSEGSLIAFLDQDDIWYSQHLRVLEQSFKAASVRPLGWTYSNLDEIEHDGRMARPNLLDRLDPNEHPKTTLAGCLRQDMFILPGASLISRAAFENVGGFDDKLRGYEDDDLFLKLFCCGYRNIYINESLMAWRIHAESTSRSKTMSLSRMKYFETLINKFSDGPYIRDVVAPRFVRAVFSDFNRGIKNNDQSAIDLSCQQLMCLIPFLPKRIRYTQFIRLKRKLFTENMKTRFLR